MHRQPAEIATDTNVCVVWSEDIDPLAATPLWASVRFVAADSLTPHEPRSNGLNGVVIEVSATPPSHRRRDQAGRGSGRL